MTCCLLLDPALAQRKEALSLSRAKEMTEIAGVLQGRHVAGPVEGRAGQRRIRAGAGGWCDPSYPGLLSSRCRTITHRGSLEWGQPTDNLNELPQSTYAGDHREGWLVPRGLSRGVLSTGEGERLPLHQQRLWHFENGRNLCPCEILVREQGQDDLIIAR